MQVISPYLGDPSSMREKRTKLFMDRADGAVTRDVRNGRLAIPMPTRGGRRPERAEYAWYTP